MSSEPQPPEGARASRLTLLLRQMQQGDRHAGDEAVGLIYGELHRIASSQLRREAPGHTLVATALVNEAYLRLSGGAFPIESRGHFLAIASQQMRRILVDHARARDAQRRGGGAIEIGLDQVEIGSNAQNVDVLMLDEVLSEFEKMEPRAAKVVELRYFGGHTDKEVAEVLGVSIATVRRDWEFARCWLFDRIQHADESLSGDR